MPCYLIKVRYTAKIDNMDKAILVEALKLMDGVQSVVLEDFWVTNGVTVNLKNGQRLIGRIVGNEVQFEGSAGKVGEEVLKYYTAVAQAVALKKQNYQVNVQRQGNLLRLTAKR